MWKYPQELPTASIYLENIRNLQNSVPYLTCRKNRCQCYFVIKCPNCLFKKNHKSLACSVQDGPKHSKLNILKNNLSNIASKYLPNELRNKYF